MNMKTSLFGLGLLVVTGAFTTSACGGTDDGGSDTSKAGTSNNTSGSASGGNSTSGSSSTAAGTNSSGGTNNNGGTDSNGGTNSTAGSNNGGSNNNGGAGNGGEGPGLGNGGAGVGDDCPATAPADGTTCTRQGGLQNACPYDTAICTCQGRQNREWNCTDFNGGAGGAGGGQLECPATKPDDGAVCGETPGFCQFAGGGCVCGRNGEWNCF